MHINSEPRTCLSAQCLSSDFKHDFIKSYKMSIPGLYCNLNNALRSPMDGAPMIRRLTVSNKRYSWGHYCLQTFEMAKDTEKGGTIGS